MCDSLFVVFKGTISQDSRQRSVLSLDLARLIALKLGLVTRSRQIALKLGLVTRSRQIALKLVLVTRSRQIALKLVLVTRSRQIALKLVLVLVVKGIQAGTVLIKKEKLRHFATVLQSICSKEFKKKLGQLMNNC